METVENAIHLEQKMWYYIIYLGNIVGFYLKSNLLLGLSFTNMTTKVAKGTKGGNKTLSNGAWCVDVGLYYLFFSFRRWCANDF